MKKILFLFLIISFEYIEAQNFIKGFEALKQNNFYYATDFFYKYQNSKKNVVAFYGLALTYSNEKNKNKNLKTAYEFAKKTKITLKNFKPVEKSEFKKKYGLSDKSVDTLINFILRVEYQAVLPTPEYWTLFINSYYDSQLAKQLENKRDSLFYYKTKQTNNIDMLERYASQYPDSKYKEKALKDRDSLLKILFEDAYKNFEYFSVMEFKKKYPYYLNDSAHIYEGLALMASQLKLHLGFSESAIPYYSRFIRITAPNEMAFQTLLMLIKPSLDSNDFKRAIDTIYAYKNYFTNFYKIDTLIKIINKGKNKIKKYPFSNNINTDGMEYAPVVTADDSTIYFCGRNRTDNLGLEDIYVSKLQKNGEWSKPEIVKSLSTNKKNEAPLSISPDGNTLVMFIDGNVYISHKTQAGWQQPQPIETINSNFWDADAYITADGNAIIFSSDRPGGVGQYHPFQSLYHADYVGNLDIYVVVKIDENTWSSPINLGTSINTPFAERSPFLHYDMKTLYFASDGWTGVGKYDIFKSTRLSDTSWTQWSAPINLGLDINSSDKETDYKISADGLKAYFTKRASNSDIFVTELPKQVRPSDICIVKGFIFDKFSNKPIDAQIVWENLDANQILGSLNSDPENGKYLITLPFGKNYGLYVSKQGYYPTSQNFDLSRISKSKTFEYNFYLVPIDSLIEGNATIELKNIFFDFDKSDLKPSSLPELNRLLDFLNKNSNVKIEISGHTDNVGNENYNQSLSQKRAEAVQQYLINNGVDENRLKAVGFGSSAPTTTNQTEEGRQKNRRVEIKVLK